MEQPDPVAALFERAKSHRIPMSRICERAGIDPTTPSRWKRKKNGATVEALKRLDLALSELAASASPSDALRSKEQAA